MNWSYIERRALLCLLKDWKQTRTFCKYTLSQSISEYLGIVVKHWSSGCRCILQRLYTVHSTLSLLAIKVRYYFPAVFFTASATRFLISSLFGATLCPLSLLRVVHWDLRLWERFIHRIHSLARDTENIALTLSSRIIIALVYSVEPAIYLTLTNWRPRTSLTTK